MSDRIKAIIGEDLYNQVIAKGIKPSEIDIIPNNYVPMGRFNEVNENLKSANGKIGVYERQVNETKDLLKGSEIYKQQFQELSTKYETDLANKNKEIANVIKTTKVKEELVKAGAKHIDLLMKDIDLDKISIEGENLVGFNDILSGVKTRYVDMFAQTKSNGLPAGGGGNTNSNPADANNNDNPFTKYLK